MSKTINVTDKFRIVQESNQYVLEKLHIVDPKKSPTYDSTKNDGEVSMKWKDEGYFGLHASGLASAIKQIIVREVGLRGEEVISLKEYIKSIKEVSKVVDDAVSDLG
jgi:hypothetical protein